MPKAEQYSSYPPGFWRRIRLHPYPDRIVAGLEDDAHRFVVVLHHHERCIVTVDTQVERYPWSTCTDAGAFLSRELAGCELHEVEGLEVRQHCTHLYDLAVLSAAYVDAPQAVCLDMRVAERTRAVLLKDGEELLCWNLNGTYIEEPAEWARRDLRQLSSWKHELTSYQARLAALLRRAVFVSGVRRHSTAIAGDESVQPGRARAGACYTYQMPHMENAVRTLHVRDFSSAQQPPLQHFDPDLWAADPRSSS